MDESLSTASSTGEEMIAMVHVLSEHLECRSC